jgi:hypothetical protein
MYLNVYKVHIDETRYHEVNDLGWSGVEWGRAHMRVGHLTQSGAGRENDERVLDAAKAKCYRHAQIIEADDLELVFSYDNGMPTPSVNVIWHPPGYRSMSIGEVVIDGLTDRGWVCVDCGFAPLAPETVREFQSLVSTWCPDLSAA